MGDVIKPKAATRKKPFTGKLEWEWLDATVQGWLLEDPGPHRADPYKLIRE